MRKRFYLVRHGDKVKTPGDPPLSELGNYQAKLTAEFFSKMGVSRIISSPILRTQQTAKHITNLLDIDYEIEPQLKERVNWGDDPNQGFEDFLAMWNRATKERNWQPPVGDSSEAAGRRIESVINKLLDNDDQHIVIVTHGGVITDFLRNVFSKSQLNEHITDFESSLDDNIKECSITVLEVESSNTQLKLVSLANTDHLI